MRKWDFKEEDLPCGQEFTNATAVINRYGNSRKADLSGVLIARVETHPWYILIWEPLPLIGPPMKTNEPDIYGIGSRLYCCYINTVILYKYPYRTKEKGQGSYDEWSRCETRLMQEDRILFEGEEYIIYPGSALFKEGKFWMLHRARKIIPKQ